MRHLDEEADAHLAAHEPISRDLGERSRFIAAHESGELEGIEAPAVDHVVPLLEHQ